MRIHPERPADWPEILMVYADAFGQSAEADIVQRLRDDGDLILSLAAYHEEKPVGHIVFSRLVLNETPAVKGCVLAPIAVSRSRQREGIGSALIREGLRYLKEASLDLVVVLGDPNYYKRFGFSPKLARKLKTPYDGPYVQALSLTEEGQEVHGPVSYARAFAELR